MSFIQYLKSKIKYVAGVAGLAAILSQAILPAVSTSAADPRFNFMSGDHELIRGANVTKGESIWKNPVSGQVNDEFRAIVYYHNGNIDTVAKNTTIKVHIPASTTNKTAKVTATISADNATAVSSTVVDGVIVGNNGLVVNFDQDVNLEFINGSVKWFPDSYQKGEANQQPSALPNSQTGDNIKGSGINIGDINGCWDYAGFVTFGFKATAQAAPSLSINKEVRNVSKGETNFEKVTSSVRGDQVEFDVKISNDGNVDLPNTILSDKLPSGLTYSNGTFSRTAGSVVTALSDADALSFFGTGLNIGTFAKNTILSYKFKATVNNNVAAGKLTNNATVKSGSIVKSSAADVLVNVGQIVKSKSAFNNTKNLADVKADAGDLITYTLTTKNVGLAPMSFTIEDNISEVLKYADVVSISDNGKVEGSMVKYGTLTINPNQTIVRTFQIKVKEASLGVCFVNTYGNSVTVCTNPGTPVMHIKKTVRDVTTGVAEFTKSNEAFAGDTLEYKIEFSNTGNAPADNVVFTDLLPVGTQYIAGTTVVSIASGKEQTLLDGIVGSGVTIQTIPAGVSGYIKLKASISASLAGAQILENKASLTVSGNTISDTALTKIKVPVVKGTTLPKTGGTAAMSFLTTSILGICFLYLKYKKLEFAPEREIINSLLS